MMVLKRVGLLLLSMLLLALAVFAYLAMTQDGLQRLVSFAQKTTGGNLAVSQSTGKLIGPATLAGVKLDQASGLSVVMDNVSFDWSPLQLFRRTAQIDELTIDGMTVVLPPPSESETSGEPVQLRDFALPVNADLKNILITDVRVFRDGAAEPFVLHEIKLDASGRDSSLKLVKLSINGPTFTFGMDGTVDMKGAWPVTLHPQWTFEHEMAGTFAGQGTLSGDTEALQVLHKVTGAASSDIEVVLTEVTGDIGWDGDISARIEDLGVLVEGAQGVPLTLKTNTRGTRSGYSATGKLDSGHAMLGAASTAFSLQGDLSEIVIDDSVTTIAGSPVQLSVDGTTRFDTLQSRLNIALTDFQWPLQVTDQLPIAVVPTGQFTLDGSAEDLRVTGSAQVSTESTGPLELSIDAGVTPESIAVNELVVSPPDAKADTLSVQGTFDIEEQIVSLTAEIDQLTWPPDAGDAPPLVEVPSGQVTVQGPVNDYRLNVVAETAGKDIPSGTWSLDASGSQSELKHFNILGETLSGTVTGDGALSWQPTTQWRFDLRTNGIDPSVKWSGFNGNINFEGTTSGEMTADGLRSEVRIAQLTGLYQQQPLSGGGLIAIDNSQINIDQLAVDIGDASIAANGVLSDQISLKWAVDVPGLEKLVSTASGYVALQGSVAGSREEPVVNFTVDAANVVTDGVSIGEAKGSGNIDVTGGVRSTLKLTLEDIVSGAQVFDSVAIDGAGTPAEHVANISLAGTLVNADLTADGGVENGRWKGVLESLNLANPEMGDWSLVDVAPVEFSAENLQLNALCLQSLPAELCVDGRWDLSNGVSADLRLDALDAKRFSDYLPRDLLVDAPINAEARISIAPGASPIVVADVAIPGGKMEYIDGGEPGTSTLGASHVQLDYRDDSLQSTVDLDLGPDIGSVKATARIGQLSSARTLDGTVQTAIKDISPFSTFVPGLDSFDGALNTNMKLAGSVDKPQVAGDSELDALVLEVPSVAMKLVDGKIIARSNGRGGLALSGKAESGDGTIELSGDYDPATGNLDATIKGSNFRVANAARQRAEVSPDIRVTKDGDDIKVSGLLHIPSAFIDTSRSSGLVKESADVVLVNTDAGEERAPGSRMTIDVRVTLGDDVKVKAGQFSGTLAGELVVEQAPDAVPTGVGAIEVVSGDFIVYGQTLTMERGRILFGGGPINNPALEFDVARLVEAHNVKAGARIRGTAQAPVLQLQSEPAQTDANTLSFILLGTPVDTRGASYTLGKYITPDIYVSYARDLFTQVQTFSVRYKITDRLTLLASSSEDVNGSDLIYTFER